MALVGSAFNRNEYHEYFLMEKAAGVYGWQPYYIHVPTVLKSGNLNLPEPSGPVQDCIGIGLPYKRREISLPAGQPFELWILRSAQRKMSKWRTYEMWRHVVC